MAVTGAFENSNPLSTERPKAAVSGYLIHPNTTPFRFYAELRFLNIVKTGPQTVPSFFPVTLRCGGNQNLLLPLYGQDLSPIFWTKNTKKHKSAEGNFRYLVMYLRLRNPHKPRDRHLATSTSGLHYLETIKWTGYPLKIRVYIQLWRKKGK